MARALTHCPACGSRVTPFAAGCAVCGADLEAERAARERRRVPVPGAGGLPRPRLGDDGLRLAIALLLVLGAPLFGLILCCWFAWQLHHEGRFGWRNAMLGLAALAVLELTLGPTRFGLWRLFG